MGVLSFHVLNVAYNYKAVIANNPPIAYYLLVAVIGYVGAFDVLFITLSALVNTISINKQWYKRITIESTDEDKRKLANKLLKVQVIRGLFIMLMGYVSEALLNGALLSALLHEYPTTEELWQHSGNALFFAQILVMIGLGNIIISYIYIQFLRSGKSKGVIIKNFLLLTIILLVLTPIVQGLYDATGLSRNLRDTWWERSFIENLGNFLLAPVISRFTPIFPNLAFSFIGSWIALIIADGEIKQKDLNKILYLSMILFVAGTIMGILKLGDDYEFADAVMAEAGSLLLMVIMLYFIEVRGKTEKFAKKTVWIRRFGIVTLTLWSMQWTVIIPLEGVHWSVNLITGQNVPFLDGPIMNHLLTGWQTWGIVILILIFFHIMLVIWGKFNFKYSFEWMTVKLLSKGRKDAGERLNLSGSLYNVESILTRAQDFYGRGTKISMFLVFFLYALVYAVVILL